MLLALLPKIEYSVLVQASRQVASQIPSDNDDAGDISSSSSSRISIPDLPDELPAELVKANDSSTEDDDGKASGCSDDDAVGDNEATTNAAADPHHDLLVALYRVLFDIHIVEGFLICPDTGRRFPIKNSIPNMILHEDEI